MIEIITNFCFNVFLFIVAVEPGFSARGGPALGWEPSLILIAAGLGFEPRLPDPESSVLPLHHPAIPLILPKICVFVNLIYVTINT